MRLVWTAPIGIAAVAAAMLAGCASSDTAPEPGTSEPTAEHGAFAHCMSEHGISDMSPLGPPADVDQQTWEQAVRACGALAPGPSGHGS